MMTHSKPAFRATAAARRWQATFPVRTLTSFANTIKTVTSMRVQGNLTQAMDLLVQTTPTTPAETAVRHLCEGDLKTLLRAPQSEIVAAYSAAQEACPTDPHADFSLGMLWRRRGELSSAQSALTGALEKQKTSARRGERLSMLVEARTRGILAEVEKLISEETKPTGTKLSFQQGVGVVTHDADVARQRSDCRWDSLLKLGDSVDKGDELGFLELDKICVSIEALEAGIVSRVLSSQEMDPDTWLDYDGSLVDVLSLGVGPVPLQTTSLPKHSTPAVSSIAEVAALIKDASLNKKLPKAPVVVITGAGISVAANLPTRQDMWARPDLDRETCVTQWEVLRNPEGLWRATRAFYANVLHDLEAHGHNLPPTAAHLALEDMKMAGIVSTVLTQNVDGLHEAATITRSQSASPSNPPAIELHGRLSQARCLLCETKVPTAMPWVDAGACLAKIGPHATMCGGPLIADVVLFGGCVARSDLAAAVAAVTSAPVVLVVGTALDASPTADLPIIAAGAGAKVVEINVEPTRLTSLIPGALFVQGDAQDILPQLCQLLLK